MKKMRFAERFDLARIYCLNVREIYDIYMICARCIAKRIKLNKPVEVATLADSGMIANLANKLNLYSGKYDNCRCVERGNYPELAQLVISEAQEIISFEG